MTGAFGWHPPLRRDTSLPEIGWVGLYSPYTSYYSRNAPSSFGAQKMWLKNRRKSFWHTKKAELFGSAFMKITIPDTGLCNFSAFAVSLCRNGLCLAWRRRDCFFRTILRSSFFFSVANTVENIQEEFRVLAHAFRHLAANQKILTDTAILKIIEI